MPDDTLMAEGGAIDEAPHCPMYFDEGVEGLEHMPSIPLTRQPRSRLHRQRRAGQFAADRALGA